MNAFLVPRHGWTRRSWLRASTHALGSVLLAPRLGLGQDTRQLPGPPRVQLWSEGTAPRSVYPDDIDGALASQLGRSGDAVPHRSRLADPEAGLSDALLDQSSVLVWWGHLRHDDVPNARAEAVAERVRDGRLGFVALYSACSSKPFRILMGTSCEPGGWREHGRPEHVRVQAPDHPIAMGVESFTIPRNDMFTEPFAIPEPQTVVLLSEWGEGRSVRSGLTWTVGKGRVVYLRAGHPAFPVLFHPCVRRLVANAVEWAARRT